MAFNLGKLHLGERVRLKSGVQEVRFWEECAKLPRSTGSGANAKMSSRTAAFSSRILTGMSDRRTRTCY